MSRIVGAFGVRAAEGPDGLSWDFSEALRDHPVLDQHGRRIGRVIGRLLRGLAGPGLSFDGSTIRLTSPCDTILDFENLVVRGLNGSFLIETFEPLPRRLYHDAGGTIPVVYCRQSRRLASSAGLLFDEDEYQGRLRHERHRRLIGQEIGGAWIPGFLTAHDGVDRLLPNFYLELSDWTRRRHWPRPDDVAGWTPLDEAVPFAANLIRDYIAAVVDEFPSVAITLTAGFDTRLLLAASRPVADRISYFTVGGDRAPGLDVQIAAGLARTLGLRHSTIRPIRADEAAARRWDHLVGDCTREINRITHPSLGQVQADVVLTGMYGETGRARLYGTELDAVQGHVADARYVSGRVSSSLSDPEVLATMDEWLASVPAMPTSKLLDLAFNELRFGGWAMAQAPAQRGVRFTLMPMAQYRVQQAFMNVRPGEQTESAMFERMVRHLWPEAMALGINRFGDWRDSRAFLAKFLSWDHIVRGLRLKLSGGARAVLQRPGPEPTPHAARSSPNVS